MKRSLSIATVSTLGIAAVLAAGTAVAAPTSTSTAFSACLKASTGALYRVAAAPNYTYTCDNGDRRVTWNSTGPQGLAGPQGPVGPMGQDGVDGVAGADGADGLDGAPGATGDQGIQGLTGVEGEKGDVGPAGPPLLFLGDYNPSYWYRYGDVVQYDGSSYASLIPLNLDNTPGGENSAWGLVASQGATGSQGVPGIQGETGLQGTQGIQGVQGYTGDTGPQGEQGIQGETGPQGEQGIQGVKGDTGDTGPQGEQGIQGVKGDTGDTGPSVGSTRNVVTDEISAPDGFSVTTVSCTGTDVAMSGGWQVPNAGMTVIHSFPAATASDWTFKLNNSSGSAQTVVLYVVCIDGGNAPV